MKIATELGGRKKYVTALAIILLALAANALNGRQLVLLQATEDKYIRDRIATIISQTVNREVEVKGVKVWTRMPPTKDSVAEVKKFGDRAIPVLTEYLRDKDTRVRAQALEFLGLLKNKKATAPLREVVLKDASPTLRMIALRWLSELPWDSISSIVQQATTDSDANVRETALALIKNHQN